MVTRLVEQLSLFDS